MFICLDIIAGAAGCVSESEFEDEDNKVVLPEEKSSNLYIFKERKNTIHIYTSKIFNHSGIKVDIKKKIIFNFIMFSKNMGYYRMCRKGIMKKTQNLMNLWQF